VRASTLNRFAGVSSEEGFTLVEMLVAMAMGIVVLGAVTTLMVGALRSEPGIAQKAADVQTARFVMERMTRELRQGSVVNKAEASTVSFQTYVRHSSCGGSTYLPSTSPSIKCQVTYSCAGESCSRTESALGVYTGTAVKIVSGLGNTTSVFNYSPDNTPPTYVGITITIPAAGSGSATVVSDGASLRNATLAF
jgi:Tfp pilus assembly protein PilW